MNRDDRCVGTEIAVGIAAVANQIRAWEVADAAERERRWAATRDALDVLAPEIVECCKQLGRKATKLDGVFKRKAWIFEVRADGEPGRGSTCMHLAFLRNGRWELLGHHHGQCKRVVDKAAPFHPGLRQGFVYDTKRHEADVVFKYTGEQIRDSILRQLIGSAGC